MKITTTTSAQINLTLVLPDEYIGKPEAEIREALLNDEAKVLSVEVPDGSEVFSCACYDIQHGSDVEKDETPLTSEEQEAIELGHYFTYYYS